MPRRSQLVCQHLENVSREALEKYQHIIRHYVRHRQGVYALYRRTKIYYVGLASSLSGRLATHLRDRHAGSWDRFSVYLTIGDSHLRELESLILRVAKPPGNKQKGRFARSEDLRAKFRRDLREHHRAEDDALLGKAVPKRRPHPKPDDARPITLAKFVSHAMVLRAHHKGRMLTARLRRDGTIRFGGRIYDSPSRAARVAVNRQTCNGWTFWEFERAPGDWVALDELRK